MGIYLIKQPTRGDFAIVRQPGPRATAGRPISGPAKAQEGGRGTNPSPLPPPSRPLPTPSSKPPPPLSPTPLVASPALPRLHAAGPPPLPAKKVFPAAVVEEEEGDRSPGGRLANRGESKGKEKERILTPALVEVFVVVRQG